MLRQKCIIIMIQILCLGIQGITSMDTMNTAVIGNDTNTAKEVAELRNENFHMAFEKYFGLKQGELARMRGMEDLSTCGKFGFLNSHFGGVTFDIDDGILVQYSNDLMSPIWEEALPRSIIITEQTANIGFMNARAGMDFAQIQENAYAAEIQEGFMYFEDGVVYYIQYADEFYEYTFVSNFEGGRDSWLIVDKRNCE